MASPPKKLGKILIVDDDAPFVRLNSTVLRHKGYEVTAASDGHEALTKLKTLRPDLIISDVQMPRLDGWDLIRRIRSTPELSLIPVIFLTALGSTANRIQGYKLGADDYANKPIGAEELTLRVANALKQRGRLETTIVEPARVGPGVHGTLDQIGLPSLLNLLAMESKTGRLRVYGTDESKGGEILLRNGNVVRARAVNTRAYTGPEAVYQLLSWTEGRFEFRSATMNPDFEPEMNMPASYLLMEAARLADEASKANDPDDWANDVFGTGGR